MKSRLVLAPMSRARCQEKLSRITTLTTMTPSIDNKITCDYPQPKSKMMWYASNAETACAIGGLGLPAAIYTDKGEIFLNELNTMPGFT